MLIGAGTNGIGLTSVGVDVASTRSNTAINFEKEMFRSCSIDLTVTVSIPMRFSGWEVASWQLVDGYKFQQDISRRDGTRPKLSSS